MCEQIQSVCIGKPTKAIWKIGSFFFFRKLPICAQAFAEHHNTDWRNNGNIVLSLCRAYTVYRLGIIGFPVLAKEPNHLLSLCTKCVMSSHRVTSIDQSHENMSDITEYFRRKNMNQ